MKLVKKMEKQSLVVLTHLKLCQSQKKKAPLQFYNFLKPPIGFIFITVNKWCQQSSIRMEVNRSLYNDWSKGRGGGGAN